MNFSGIYKIESKLIPERIYIGSAVNILSRKEQHFRLLRNNNHHSIKLQHHYNKYGIDDLHLSILLLCKENELIIDEQCFIDHYMPWFNICPNAGSQLGRTWDISEQGKINIGNALRGKKKSKEAVEKGRQSRLGKKFTEEHKQHLKEAWKNRLPMSEETKKKMSIARIGNTKGFKKGCIPWNAGMKTPKEVTEKRIHTRKINGKRHIYTDEQRQKMREVWVIRKLNKTK